MVTSVLMTERTLSKEENIYNDAPSPLPPAPHTCSRQYGVGTQLLGVRVLHEDTPLPSDHHLCVLRHLDGAVEVGLRVCELLLYRHSLGRERGTNTAMGTKSGMWK